MTGGVDLVVNSAGVVSAFKDLNSFIDNKKVKSCICSTYSFENVKEAQTAFSGNALGKIVIEINQ